MKAIARSRYFSAPRFGGETKGAGARFSKSSLPKTGRSSMEKGPGRAEKGGKLHCFYGVKGGLTANSSGPGIGSQQAPASRVGRRGRVKKGGERG